MFKKILMPLDGFEAAESALPYGEELAARLGAEIVLYHFHKPGQQLDDRAYLNKVAEEMRANVMERQPRSSEVKITPVIDTEETAASICALTEKNEIDLIVMTSVGASGLKFGKTLGTVAEQICRTVSQPVLLVKPHPKEPTNRERRLINHMLIALDGSELSRLALPVGTELASRLNIKITLFQMAAMLRLYGEGAAGYQYIDYASLEKGEEKRVKAEMAALESELKQLGLDAKSVVTLGSDAAAEIIDVSKKTGADLAVMSTHGRSGLGRLLLGSVAEKVLSRAEMPLLLVHARAA